MRAQGRDIIDLSLGEPDHDPPAFALEAAHVALLADDWRLVPEVFHIAQRTMGVVKFNLGFTVVYNVVGLTLAAAGLLPPMLAAAAQSIPDLAILGNSARLMRAPGDAQGENDASARLE